MKQKKNGLAGAHQQEEQSDSHSEEWQRRQTIAYLLLDSRQFIAHARLSMFLAESRVPSHPRVDEFPGI